MKAFSLLEMSIVLIIIGAMVAGVSVGNSMLRAGQEKKLIKELQENRAAITAFTSNYGQIPGDFTKATLVWPGQGAENGNGDNMLGLGNETVQMWKHLSLGGFIEGEYTGTGPTNLVAGVNVFKSKYEGVAIATFVNPFGTTLNAGRARSGYYSVDSFFTPQQALKMDIKYDDGGILTGELNVRNGYYTNWVELTGADVCYERTTSLLNTANTAAACILEYKLDFIR